MRNGSTVPSVFTPLAHKSTFIVSVCSKWHQKYNKKLDPKGTHGHDIIITRKIKSCGDSIYKPLEIV